MTKPVDPSANTPYCFSTPRAALNEEAARTARDIHEIVATHQNAAPGALIGAGIGGWFGGPIGAGFGAIAGLAGGAAVDETLTERENARVAKQQAEEKTQISKKQEETEQSGCQLM